MTLKMAIVSTHSGKCNTPSFSNNKDVTLVLNSQLTISGDDGYINEWLKHFFVLSNNKAYENYNYSQHLMLSFSVPVSTNINISIIHTENWYDIDSIFLQTRNWTESLSSGNDFNNPYQGIYLDTLNPFYNEETIVTLTDENDNPVPFDFWLVKNTGNINGLDSYSIQDYCNGRRNPTQGESLKATDGTANQDGVPEVASDSMEPSNEYQQITDNQSVDPENQNFNDDQSDEINVSQVGIVPSAGGNQYNLLNTADVNAFFNWFWNDIIKEESISDFLLNSISRLYGDLSKCVLSLKYCPLALDQSTTDGMHKIQLGRFQSKISAQDCNSGSLQRLVYVSGRVSPITNNFIDTSPYTQAYFYLPFYGFAPCDINKYLNRNLEFALWADIRTGLGCWVITNEIGNSRVPIDRYDFSLMIDQPITLDDGGRIMDGIMSSVASVGQGIPVLGSVSQIASGGFAGGSATISAHTACGSLLTMLNAESIYLIRVVPQYYRPDDMENIVGRICRQTYKVSELKGFCVFKNVKIDYGNTTNSDNSVVFPTEKEMQEICSLMESGIMLERYEREV